MKDKKRERRAAQQPLPEAGSSKRRFGLIAVALLAAGGVWGFFELVVWNKVPAALVGKWVVTRGPDDGAMIDIYRNGTMITTVNKGADEATLTATIRVEDKKIFVTTRHLQTGQTGTRVQTIAALDDTRLVLQDERGATINLERAEFVR